ncbi:MAG: tRNA preQ1(34) S-adenosylmethionine ribosyltransferase-isomerase QueA [Candidatus Thermoplasmatota archaeon]|nr:tRNA preQ1(34) S-adenosylmethionine ribosyltransferase-isomerase QueA [Candidatus Thermoplasmatota archaeon]
MKLSKFDYELPQEKIAQRPMRPRDESKLFYLGRNEKKHLHFQDITDLLQDGDVLVKNKSKVIPARVRGEKDTGGKIEVLFNRPVEKGWECLIKGSNIKEGRQIVLGKNKFEVVESWREGRFVIDCKEKQVYELMTQEGEMPTPPYIKKDLNSSDEYQTVYAKEEGSVAAPTAGLHFTEELLDEIKDKGVEVHDIILHVGPGTFLPVKENQIEDHTMDEEYYEVGENAAKAITKANEENRRVIFVGTTTVRAVETVSENGVVKPGKGWTQLYIYPGYEFQSGMDLLLTNFHLPKSTLIMLVSAFAGRERILEAYKEAVEKDYRFYSFGDSMLIEGL